MRQRTLQRQHFMTLTSEPSGITMPRVGARIRNSRTARFSGVSGMASAGVSPASKSPFWRRPFQWKRVKNKNIPRTVHIAAVRAALEDSIVAEELDEALIAVGPPRRVPALGAVLGEDNR